MFSALRPTWPSHRFASAMEAGPTISRTSGTAWSKHARMFALVCAASTAHTALLVPHAAAGPLFRARCVLFDSGNTPCAIAILDVNGDRRLDVVTANAGDSTVSVFAGDGTGLFAPHVDYAAGSGPAAVALGD